ncbi:cupin domain-containing protein [Pelagibius sp. Alg239-R121]|uniref:cupin domain-containing protein n=1 Tax=Pelagibius sp. Alg239-R121 TaxID=2993448 RepID=UPI0024A63474|nr:cupin domain-containing protein [Pelagibius sp. Alg239-R121]
MNKSVTAEDIIKKLGLLPHPEGGHFIETYRHAAENGGRGDQTAIYYLLGAGERSHWHRVDAVEIWHWYAGAALDLGISEDGTSTRTERLGNDLIAGEKPQVIIPAQAWQSAESYGDWTLVGCTVAPAFEFEGFELAAPDWKPS